MDLSKDRKKYKILGCNNWHQIQKVVFLLCLVYKGILEKHKYIDHDFIQIKWKGINIGFFLLFWLHKVIQN